MKRTLKKLDVIKSITGLSLGLCGCIANHSDSLNQHITQAMQMQDHHSAEAALHTLIKQNPKQALLFSALGYQLDQMHRFDEAFQAYQQAIKLSPEQSEWHNNFGVFLCQHHQTRRGQQSLKKALQLSKDEEKNWILENMARCHSSKVVTTS